LEQRTNLKRLPALQVLTAGVVILTTTGTVGFHLIEGWSWFDSLYMVVITFSTVGYGEVHPLSYAGRVFNLTLIMAGVALVFLMIGALTQTLLEFELGKVFGKRKMEREIAHLKDHYIICGAGRVGNSVAQELSLKPCPFVIIENNEKGLADLDPKWLVVVGDAASEKVLRSAGIERARGLVAAATTDATNIYIVLTAKSIQPGLKVIARASEERAEKHLKTAGADVVISPYAAAGHRIAQSFMRPNVLDFLDITTARSGTLEMIIEEIQVAPQSSLTGMTVGTSGIHHKLGIMILAIRRPGNEILFNPRAEDAIRAGDFLIAMGEPSQLTTLEAMASPGRTAVS
jgi:voltage-gated potassium channel